MTKNTKPDFIVYNVEDRGEGNKDYWQRIGAAWKHEDGQGFNLSLHYLPIKEGRIVMRVRTDKPQGDEGEAGE